MVLNPADYPNLLDVREISCTEIEEQIHLYALNFPSEKNEEVEWRIKLPSFADAFYNYFYFNRLVPDQENLWVYYRRLNERFFNGSHSTETMNAIRARLFRAYPSFVRDLHFSAFLHEKLKGGVIYNRKLDIEHGIDILIVRAEKLFAVNLFIHTHRSLLARKKKESRHTSFSNVHYVEVPIRSDDCKQCGDFFLYGEKQFESLKSLLQNLADIHASVHSSS